MTDSPETLKSDPRNGRKHSRDNLYLISDALREVGAARSIVVDADSEMVIAVRRSGLTAMGAIGTVYPVPIGERGRDDTRRSQFEGLTARPVITRAAVRLDTRSVT